MTTITRSQVVACARSFLGTPYRHRGRSRQLGVDCVGFVIALMNELGVAQDYKKPYAPHPDGKVLRREIDARCAERLPGEMDEGDLGLFWTVRRSHPQHVGVLVRSNTAEARWGMIHAFSKARTPAFPAGRVAENDIDRFWYPRLLAVYRLPGVV